MTKYVSQGTVFEREGTPIAQVTTLNGPNNTREQIEVTDLDSVRREYLPAVVDGGEIACDLIFDPGDGTHQSLLTDLDDNATVTYAVHWTQIPERWEFEGLVLEFSITSATNDALRASVRVKLSGPINMTSS